MVWITQSSYACVWVSNIGAYIAQYAHVFMTTMPMIMNLYEENEEEKVLSMLLHTRQRCKQKNTLQRIEKHMEINGFIAIK